MTSTLTFATNQAGTASAATKLPHGAKHLLDEDFTPGPFDYVIGRGKQVKESPGNLHLCDMIRAISKEYTSGDKAAKSNLLSQLVAQVYEKSTMGGFVKKDPETGRWFAVEDALARTSAAQAVRDCLHDNYKSSRQFKQQRRQKAKTVTKTTKTSPTTSSNTLETNEMPALTFTAPSVSLSAPSLTGTAMPSLPSLPFTVNCLPRSVSLYDDMQPMPPQQPRMTNWQAQPAMLKTTTNTDSNAIAHHDLFAMLASAFPTRPDVQENPFEPVPIAHSVSDSKGEHDDTLGEVFHSINVELGLDDLDMTLRQNAAKLSSNVSSC
jgi:hypothetical protein